MWLLFAGLELLLGLLGSINLKQQKDASAALYKLANRTTPVSPMDAAPPSPTPQVWLSYNIFCMFNGLGHLGAQVKKYCIAWSNLTFLFVNDNLVSLIGLSC